MMTDGWMNEFMNSGLVIDDELMSSLSSLVHWYIGATVNITLLSCHHLHHHHHHHHVIICRNIMVIAKVISIVSKDLTSQGIPLCF